MLFISMRSLKAKSKINISKFKEVGILTDKLAESFPSYRRYKKDRKSIIRSIHKLITVNRKFKCSNTFIKFKFLKKQLLRLFVQRFIFIFFFSIIIGANEHFGMVKYRVWLSINKQLSINFKNIKN